MGHSAWTPVDETSSWKPVAEERPDFSLPANRPSGVTLPKIKMEMDPWADTHEIPRGKVDVNAPVGVSEGQGLREALSDYDRAGFGTIGSGIGDVARGQIARGGHKIISGAGTAIAPALGLALPAMAAAPGATALTIGTGIAAGKAGRAGAEAFGATPDQADLTEDLGNIAGGSAGPKLPGLVRAAANSRLGQSAGVVAKAAGELPVINRFVKAGKALGDLKDIWAPAPPVDAGAPLPANPGSDALLQNLGLTPGDAGAPFPARPPNEVLNPSLISPSRGLPGMWSKEVTQPPAVPPAEPVAPIPPRQGLLLKGNVEAPAVPAPVVPAQALAPAIGGPAPSAVPSLKISPAAVESQLGEALGAKLPAGFTPTSKSSALLGYKYNPETQEFEGITKAGQHYVHGNVSPEQAQGFSDNPSAGKAWNDLRNSPGTVRVAKVVNGKRMATPSQGLQVTPEGEVSPLPPRLKVSPGASATEIPPVSFEKPAPKAAAPAADEDLTGILQQSLRKINPDLDIESRVATPEPDVATTANTERIQRAQSIITDPESTPKQRVKALGDLQDALGIQADTTKIAERAQAGLSRKMAQPRAEVEAPTETRKNLLRTREDFLNARKSQRNQ